MAGSNMTGKLKKLGPRLTVCFTSDDYHALAALADKDDVYVLRVVRGAIDDYLEKHRHEAEPIRPLRVLQKAERPAHRAHSKE